jgi:site-specific DNA-methyltransferase (adenine-specific)
LHPSIPNIDDFLSGGARWHLASGDALAFLAAIPDATIDAVITDPPYSSGGAFRGDRMAATSLKYVAHDSKLARPEFLGDSRDQRAYRYWCALWLSECLRVAKPGAPICVFTDWRQLPTTTDAVQAGGWLWRGVVAWDKTEAARPARGRFRNQCEYVVWGSKGPMATNRLCDALPGCFRHAVAPRDKHHIAGKPTPLMRGVVRICEPGGIVLDPFAGSGTTGVAALAEGRRFVGCELSSEYHERACARLDQTAA